MEKHTSKPRNVFMYGGVCSGGYIKPTAFNDYDIVITSYNQLEENLKAIRNPVSKMLRQLRRNLFYSICKKIIMLIIIRYLRIISYLGIIAILFFST